MATVPVKVLHLLANIVEELDDSDEYHILDLHEQHKASQFQEDGDVYRHPLRPTKQF